MASGASGRVAVLSAVVAVLVLVAGAAVVGYRQTFRVVGDPRTSWMSVTTDGPPSLPPSTSGPPSASPSASPSPSSSPTPSPSPTRRAAAPTRQPVKPVPSHAKVPAPPPAAPPPPPSCSTSYSGTAATKAQVGAALDTAAQVSYGPRFQGPPPDMTIQVDPVLLKAVAWQESGWQSNIVSCYGAYGAMQMTSDTAAWMNDKYGTDHDMHTLSGNASLGAEYLVWLIYYFGHFCFGDNYDINQLDPNAPDLRDAVLAAYNLGIGAVDTSAGLVIPNRAYTNAVEGLMQSQPWENQ